LRLAPLVRCRTPLAWVRRVCCVPPLREGDGAERRRDGTDQPRQCGLKRARIDHERDTENERSDSNPLQSLDAPLVPQISENSLHYCAPFSLTPPWGQG